MAIAITTPTFDQSMLQKASIQVDQLAQLRLFQLVSPALPIGAFAYSQALEYAVEAGWVKHGPAAQDWMEGVLRHSVATLDVPVMKRLYQAWRSEDYARLGDWNRFLLACRETRELRAEERHLGGTLARLLNALGVANAAAEEETTYAAMFALAAVHWGISIELAAIAYIWTWLENQVMAAIKLVPLGQTEGQRILAAIAERIPVSVESSLQLNDEEIQSSVPGVMLASILHETQYTRLFRS